MAWLFASHPWKAGEKQYTSQSTYLEEDVNHAKRGGVCGGKSLHVLGTCDLCPSLSSLSDQVEKCSLEGEGESGQRRPLVKDLVISPER